MTSVEPLHLIEPLDLVDSDAGEAYRSLERSLCAGLDAPAGGGLVKLAHATLQAYARALGQSLRGPDIEVWATFVRCAASLYDAPRGVRQMPPRKLPVGCAPLRLPGAARSAGSRGARADPARR